MWCLGIYGFLDVNSVGSTEPVQITKFFSLSHFVTLVIIHFNMKCIQTIKQRNTTNGGIQSLCLTEQRVLIYYPSDKVLFEIILDWIVICIYSRQRVLMSTSADSNPGCNQERCTGITPNTTRCTGKVKWYDAVKVSV